MRFSEAVSFQQQNAFFRSCMFSTVECVFQKLQLLRLNVPQLFMLVALDEGPGPPIKYQYAELSKLYAVVSHLVRCCDISHRCVSSISVSVPQVYLHSSLLLNL